MKILFTKSEGSFWNPLHLHNIDRVGLLSLLTDGIGDMVVLRDRNYTILKGVMVSDTVKPNLIHEKNLRFHSLMLTTGTIFDSYFYHIDKSNGLDHSFFQYRHFGLPAKRFEELWKDMTKKAHEVWLDNEAKQKLKRLNNKRYRAREKKK